MGSLKVYCFGNEHLAEDSLAKEISKTSTIKGLEFINCDSPEEITLNDSQELVIMDVIKGIQDITILHDIEDLKEPNLFSLHDFDLSYFLKLHKAMGTLKKITIIGLPQTKEKKKIKSKLEEIFQKITNASS